MWPWGSPTISHQHHPVYCSQEQNCRGEHGPGDARPLEWDGKTCRRVAPQAADAQMHTGTVTLRLEDFLGRLGQKEKFEEHHSRSLVLDPTKQYIQGLQKMEANTDGVEDNYDLHDMEEV